MSDGGVEEIRATTGTKTTRVKCMGWIVIMFSWISFTQRKWRPSLSFSATHTIKKAFLMSAITAIKCEWNLSRMSKIFRLNFGPISRQSFSDGWPSILLKHHKLHEVSWFLCQYAGQDGEVNSEGALSHSRLQEHPPQYHSQSDLVPYCYY